MKNYLKISRLLLIIGVVLFSAYLYYPENEIEEVNLGDVNTSETINYPFEIIWDDEGFESNRPTSITYNLYNVLDENAVVSTVTLTSSNIDSNDSNKWNGVFNNVPNYNSDETKAEYIIKQQEISNYKQKYDIKDYNAICIEFGDNVFNGGTASNHYLYFLFHEDKAYYYVNPTSSSSYYQERFYSNDLKNKIICAPKSTNKSISWNYADIELRGYTAKLDIKKIYPGSIDSYERKQLSSYYYTSSDDLIHYGSFFPNVNSSKFLYYIWEPSDYYFPNHNIIVNSISLYNYDFEITWDDYGYENERPNSIVYDLYNILDENTIVSSITLTSANEDNNDSYKWKGSFTNIPIYNSDGTKANYIIKNNTLDDYIKEYNRKNANGYCISFGDNPFDGNTEKRITIGGSFAQSISRILIQNLRYNYQYESFYYDDLKNKIICVPYFENNRVISLFGNIDNLDIKDIYQTYQNRYLYRKTYVSATSDQTESFVNDNYPNNSNKSIVDYSLNKKTSVFPNANEFKYSYTKTKLKFDKYWEDEGFENLRPTSSEYYLYRKDNQSQILQTVTLTSNDADSNDSSHWIGNFENVIRFDNEGNKIDYVVREKEHPNYVNSYDSKEGLSITFNENTKFGHSTAAKMFYQYNDKWYTLSLNYGSLGDDLGGKTIDIRFPDDNRLVEYEYDPYFYLNRLNDNPYYGMREYVGTDYPEMYHNTSLFDSYALHYSYSLSNHSQDFYFVYKGDSWSNDYGLKIDNISTLGDEVVLTSRINLRELEIKKVWEDNGYETARPNSVVIDIIDANNPLEIIKTVTMTSECTVDDYNWKKTITGLPIYDNNLQEIEYMVSERKINDDYLIVYDADEYYNGLSIKFADDIKGVPYVYMGYYRNGTRINYNDKYYVSPHLGGYNLDGSSYSINYNRDDLSNRAIYHTTRDLYMYFYLSEGDFVDHEYLDNQFTNGKYKLQIVDIEPVHYESNKTYVISLDGSRRIKYSIFDDYLNISRDGNNIFYSNNFNSRKYYIWEYHWVGSLTPKKNCTVIINKYNKYDYTFEKEWQRYNINDEKPNVRFNLYNELDENTIVATKVLTNENARADNSNIWDGKFENVPKYNIDGTVAKYIIKEEDSEKYKTYYDISEHNGFCIEINDNVVKSDYFYIAAKKGDKYYYMVQNGTATINLYDYINSKICFPVNNEENGFYISNSGTNFGKSIKKIYPVYMDDYIFENIDSNSTTSYYGVNYYTSEIDDFSFLGTDSYTHFVWNGSTYYFPGSNKVINKSNVREDNHIKIFNDEGYEYNRPKEIVFGLYEEDNPVPIDMTTVKTNNCENNRCEIKFKNVQDKDENGVLKNYQIKEINDYGYDITINEKISGANYNSLCVKFGAGIPQGNYSRMVHILFKQGDINRELINPTTGSAGFESYEIANTTVCVPTPNSNEIYLYGDLYYIDIVDIYPHYFEYDDSISTDSNIALDNPIEYSGSNLPHDMSYNRAVKYTYTNFPVYYEVTNTANPVDVKFIKEDINGKPLRGAKLAIYNKSGDKLKEFTSSNREVTIKLLPSEYTIKEIEAPEGYERSNDINFVVNNDGTVTINGNTENTVKIVNETIKEKYSINLKKTLKSNEEKEFEFEISIVDFDGTLEYTGDRNGTLTFTNNKANIKLGGNEEVTIKDIPVNSKYEIRELTQDYLLTIVGDSSGILNRNESIEFINVPYEQRGDGDIVIPEEEDVPTPITGILNIASYIAGVLLLIGSIFLIIYSKKQIKKFN